MQSGSNKTSSLKKRLKLRRQQFLPMAEINVTPFVDVMLVLLIIFMVAAPLLSVGVKVDLPETEARPLPTEKEKPLTLTVDEQENIFINEVKVSRDQLKMKLVSIKRERNSDKIFLRASGQLQYERVAKLMGILTQSGFNAVSLVTDSK
jgi:biopolymer transport protein TolR